MESHSYDDGRRPPRPRPAAAGPFSGPVRALRRVLWNDPGRLAEVVAARRRVLLRRHLRRRADLGDLRPLDERALKELARLVRAASRG